MYYITDSFGKNVLNYGHISLACKLYFYTFCSYHWHSCFRHCATSRKVAGSIPDGVIGIFYWHNSSGLTMTLGLNQPLTEMSTRNISWGVKAAGADNLTTFMCRLSWNLGATTSWNSQGLSRPVMELLYLSSSLYFCCTCCINKYTGKSLHIIIHMLIYSSFCVLNFTLPTCGPKYVQVSRTTYKVDQAWFNHLHSTWCLLHTSNNL